MSTPPLASYLRSHRLKSGMSQRELAEIVGLIKDHQVSTHERSIAIPSLLAALSYEIVFDTQISEIFPGLVQAVQTNIEFRLDEMERTLHGSTAKGRRAEAIARRLEWLCERRSQTIADAIE